MFENQLKMEKSILVIDDNRDILENTSEILELAGYKTFMAESGKRGVELAQAEKPSLIVCDIMMPELDGYGVLSLIRQNPQTENIPVIFLSAKSLQRDIQKGMVMEADKYIAKPYEEMDLLNAIKKELKKVAQRHSA
jgi:CheY-like chemotaxis protein